MSLRPLELSIADVSAGLRLSSEAGWNQTAADWAVFIRHGTVFGLKHGDALVATAATLPYSGFGFVSMVLVTPAWRKRGLATRLVDQSITALRARGLVPVLDATPAGAAVYKQLGFQTMFELWRWERTASSPAPAPADKPAVRPAGMEQLDTFARIDAEAFGSDRHFLFQEFLDRAETRVFLSDRGFTMTRKGHRAAQLGPLAARTEAAARDLLAATVATLHGPIFLDVAERCCELRRWLESNGFSRQRPFQRMALGQANGFGHPACLMVMAGPEFG
jgi:GNAT superfamily N-acetyltransferase